MRPFRHQRSTEKRVASIERLIIEHGAEHVAKLVVKAMRSQLIPGSERVLASRYAEAIEKMPVVRSA